MMMNESQTAAILVFLEQYVAFLREMANDEKEKLAALVSNSLERIERAILTSQVNAKKLDNLEKKRITVQAENNCPGFTLSQLCEQAPEHMRDNMVRLCAEIRDGVAEIKWSNDKSMGVARGNVIQVNPDAVLTTVKKSDIHENPYTRAQNREHDTDTSQILITKA